MNKRWEYYKINNEKVKKISEEHGISQLLATVILNREIIEKEIDVFLNPTRNNFYNPFLIPDMEKATNRILEAIEKQEKVLIYGDYDVDGITSVTVLKKLPEKFTYKQLYKITDGEVEKL